MIDDAPTDPTTLPTDALFARAAAGETRAMVALHRRLNPRVVRVAAGVIGRVDGADDVAQEAWVQVLARIGEGILPAAHAEAALRRQVVRGALDTTRRRRRREGLLRLFGPLALRPATTPAADPLLGEHLRQALDALPEGQRVPLVLREVEGWSGAEIAEALGVSAATVDQRISRARRAMRERLEREGVERPGVPRQVAAPNPGEAS